MILCGDVQTPRPFNDEIMNKDLDSMAMTKKYLPEAKKYAMEYKNVIHESQPNAITEKMTLFVGGNHEASELLVRMPHGGFVAPNFYYAGRSSVMEFGGKFSNWK